MCLSMGIFCYLLNLCQNQRMTIHGNEMERRNEVFLVIEKLISRGGKLREPAFDLME